MTTQTDEASYLAFIPLTQGQVAVIDGADWPRVRQHKWSAHPKRNTWYAITSIPHPDGGLYEYQPGKFRTRRTTLKMHKLITGYDQTDHKDGNGLNNTRQNLRPATFEQNSRSRGMSRNNTSGLKGVRWNKARCKWMAQISVEDIDYHLGSYDNRVIAGIVHDMIAVKEFGEFACTNIERPHGRSLGTIRVRVVRRNREAA